MKGAVTLLASVGIAGLTVGIGWNGRGTETWGLYGLVIAAALGAIAFVEYALVIAWHHWIWRHRRCQVIEITRFLSPNGGMAHEATSHADRSAGSRDRRGDPSRPLAHVAPLGHDRVSKLMAHQGYRWP